MSEDQPTEFDTFAKLPGELIPTSAQVTKFAATSVQADNDGSPEGKRLFNWQSFKNSINTYTGDDLIMDKYNSTTIYHGDRTVRTMVEKIVKFLFDTFGSHMGVRLNMELTAAIDATFTMLKEKSSNGFVDFRRSPGGQRSSWEYRIHIALPSSDFPDHFHSLITTIKLEADLTEEMEWWGLSDSTSKNFSATVDVMQLIVRQGFKN